MADQKEEQVPPATSDVEVQVTLPVPQSAPELPGQTPIPEMLPVLPIRGRVMFPGTVMPLPITSLKNQQLLDDSLSATKIIALVTQRDEEQEDAPPEDLYGVGVAVMVLKMIRQPDPEAHGLSLLVHGLARIVIHDYVQREPFLKAHVERLTERAGEGNRYEAGIAQLREQARELIGISTDAPEEALTVLVNIEDPSNLADFLAANLNLDVEQKQDLLEERDIAKRIRAVHQHVSNQLEIVKLQRKIQADVQSSIGETQRKMYLREQMKAIKKELADEDECGDQILEKLRKRLEEANPSEKVMSEALRELQRLEAIPPASPEYSMLLSYLEIIVELPWNEASEDNLDLERARRVLDQDHYGLEKVKRRLIEFLAVRKLNPSGRGPIFCLAGPPGVGKTSLGQSVANALGRQFVRMSLGGIRDEAEIRGHRRTYIGAMPGRIIQEIRRAGTNNPVMMLDELDKVGADFRGDPASALLEVLDPRQNNAFVDRYLDVPFDLSQVIFIATANYMGSVPPALHDRMEVIEIAGYTDIDKTHIARKYLVPNQLQENGLVRKRCRWTLGAIRKLIDGYTREAGVRELERQIGSVCRGIAAEVASKKRSSRLWNVDPVLVRKLLGPEKHFRDEHVATRVPGVVRGLAYTPAGGEVLFIEATCFPGSGQVLMTGQIGDVMKESATAAMSLFKSRAADFNYDAQLLTKLDLHIHVPAGAVPKDGPSAGIAMYTAIASLVLDIPVQGRLAMTGEITLRGLVMPIGGVKQKTLAAARARIQTVLLPQDNQRDEQEIDKEVRSKCDIVYVHTVDEVLKHALGKAPLAKAIKANGDRQRSFRTNQRQAAQPA